MIKFIKQLFGFGAPQETVKEILTPPAKAPAATYIPAAKTVPTAAKKVRAITDTNPNAVKVATAPKPANKKRRPYRGNKVKAGVKIIEGATKGGNNTVKPAQVAKAKPVAPKAPVAKKK